MTVGLTGCTEKSGSTTEAGHAAAGVRLHVFYSGGASRAGYSRMHNGGYATFDSPFVCVDGGARVQLTGVEVAPADAGVEVSDFGVVPTDAETVMGATAQRRLRDLPQAVDLVEGDAVTQQCSSKGAARVWLELHMTRPGTVRTVRTRYIFEVSGHTGRTEWFPRGYVLTDTANVAP